MKTSLRNIGYSLFFLTGLFSSIAIVKINLGVIQLTPYNFLLYLTVLWCLINGKGYKYKLNKDFVYFIYLFCLVLSDIININLPNEWVKANLIMTINYFMFGLVLLFCDKDMLNESKSYFINGLWISSCIQLIWGMLQFFLYRTKGISLNQLVFGDFFHIESGYYTASYLGLKRITGLHWECAYYALSLTIGVILSNHIWQKGIFIVGIILSTSRTGLVTCGVVIVTEICMKIIKKNKKRNIKKISHNTILMNFIAVTVAFIISMAQWQVIFQNIIFNIQRFQNLHSDSSALVHMWYYKFLPEIFIRKFSLIQVLFGTGPSSSGYIYARYYNIYSTLNAWTIENELANQLIGVGIIGTLFCYYWFIKRLINNKNDIKNVSLIIGLLIGGIMYSYFVNWVWMVVLFFSLKGENKNEQKN